MRHAPERGSGLPDIAGTRSGRLAIAGCGRSLWDDMRALGDWPDAWMAVNAAGMHLPSVPQHWASAESDYFQYWLPLRGFTWHGDRKVMHCKAQIHAPKPGPFVQHVWPFTGEGTSSLFAVKVGLALGYGEIVLCGVPLDGAGHYYDAPWFSNEDYDQPGFLLDWERNTESFKGRVRSMSGRTREILGGL